MKQWWCALLIQWNEQFGDLPQCWTWPWTLRKLSVLHWTQRNTSRWLKDEHRFRFSQNYARAFQVCKLKTYANLCHNSALHWSLRKIHNFFSYFIFSYLYLSVWQMRLSKCTYSGYYRYTYQCVFLENQTHDLCGANIMLSWAVCVCVDSDLFEVDCECWWPVSDTVHLPSARKWDESQPVH